MRTTLVRVDGVCVGVDALGVRGRPLHCDLECDFAIRVFRLKGNDLLVNDVHLLGRVQILHVIDETLRVQVCGARRLFFGCGWALILQRDGQTLVEERHLLESLAQCLKAEIDCFKNFRIWAEHDCCSGSV